MSAVILADYRALVEVTEEMKRLRKCPEGHYSQPPMYGSIRPNEKGEGVFYACPTCKGTGLNPDQSAWWEALNLNEDKAKPKMNFVNILDYLAVPNPHILPYDTVILAETPKGLICTHLLWCKKVIHRPESDLRPWPEVLQDLIQEHCTTPYLAHGGLDGKPLETGHEINPPVSFALATPETAPVFKAFGIPTLVEA